MIFSLEFPIKIVASGNSIFFLHSFLQCSLVKHVFKKIYQGKTCKFENTWI
jgi:hypothetical protein